MGSESGEGGNVRTLIKWRRIFSTNVIKCVLCRKDVRLPVQLQRAMAAEAEAAREARAKVKKRSADSAGFKSSSLNSTPSQIIVYPSDQENIYTGFASCEDPRSAIFSYSITKTPEVAAAGDRSQDLGRIT